QEGCHSKAVTNLELHVRSKSGDEKRVICSLLPLKLEDTEACLVLFVDITVQAHAIEALRSSGKLLQTIIETIPMRIFWKDQESRFLGCNTAFAHDAGLESPEEIIGRTDYDLIWEKDADAYRADDR